LKRLTVVDLLQPALFPEDQATSLTSPVSSSVATDSFQVDCIRHPSSLKTTGRIAGLMSPLDNPKSLTAVLKHFGHERQRIELPV
jgi:hypothetical protein